MPAGIKGSAKANDTAQAMANAMGAGRGPQAAQGHIGSLGGAIGAANAAHEAARQAGVGNRNTGGNPMGVGTRNTGGSPMGPGGFTHTGGPSIGIGSFGSLTPSSLQQMAANINNWAKTPAEKAAMAARNLGWGSPAQIAGILGTFGWESNRFNPTVPGDLGTAMGLGQWRGPRQQALRNYAQQMGMPVSDPTLQMGFFNNEIRNNPAYRGARKSLLNARTSPQAIAAMNAYEQPSGYLKSSHGQPQLGGVAGLSGRLALADKYGGMTGIPSGIPTNTSPAAVASLGNTVPAPVRTVPTNSVPSLMAGVNIPTPRSKPQQPYSVPGMASAGMVPHGIPDMVNPITANERQLAFANEPPIGFAQQAPQFGSPSQFADNQVPSAAFGQLSQPMTPQSPPAAFAGNQVPSSAFGSLSPSRLATDPENASFREWAQQQFQQPVEAGASAVPGMTLNKTPPTINQTVPMGIQPQQYPDYAKAPTGNVPGNFNAPNYLSQPSLPSLAAVVDTAPWHNSVETLRSWGDRNWPALENGSPNAVTQFAGPPSAYDPGQDPNSAESINTRKGIALAKKLESLARFRTELALHGHNRQLGSDRASGIPPFFSGGGQSSQNLGGNNGGWGSNGNPPPAGNPPPQSIPWPMIALLERAYSNPWSYRNPWNAA